jgi:tetratricopeptide (TPR) repeat protein
MSDQTSQPSGVRTAAQPSAAQLLQQGLFHHHRGELGLAMDRYTEVLRSEPKHAEALYYCAVIACQENQFDEGIKLARRALDFGPPQARIHNLIGKALERQDNRLEAVKSFDAAIALDPGFAEAHGNRANILAANGMPAEALESFDKALALDPNAIADWINRGALLIELERHAEALESFDKALAIEPDNITVLMNRANALAALERHDESVAAYDEVIKRDPRLTRAYVLKGRSLNNGRRYEESLACFDKALAVSPNDPEAMNDKGRLLHILGRLDEARALVEQVIAIDPDKPSYYMELAEMKRFAPGDAHLAAMEKLFPDIDSRSTQDQLHLHFAFAKAYRDTGQHERAAQHLLQGNALKRAQIKYYDEKALMERLQRTQDVFTPELIRSLSGHGDPSDRPIFIVGMPRSGTSLVEQILSSHPRVHGAGERPEIYKAMVAITDNAMYPDLALTMTGAQLDLLGAAYLSRITAGMPPTDRFTDKALGNFLYVGLIHLALPNARIIRVRRNALDNCFSCFATLFAVSQEFTYELGELGRYYAAHHRLMDHWRKVLPQETMLEVQYEDVVDDIEGQTRRMLDYCGLEWDEACLSFHKTDRPVLTASAAQVRQPLYRSSVGRWRPYEDMLKPLREALEMPAEMPAAGEKA